MSGGIQNVSQWNERAVYSKGILTQCCDVERILPKVAL